MAYLYNLIHAELRQNGYVCAKDMMCCIRDDFAQQIKNDALVQAWRTRYHFVARILLEDGGADANINVSVPLLYDSIREGELAFAHLLLNAGAELELAHAVFAADMLVDMGERDMVGRVIDWLNYLTHLIDTDDYAGRSNKHNFRRFKTVFAMGGGFEHATILLVSALTHNRLEFIKHIAARTFYGNVAEYNVVVRYKHCVWTLLCFSRSKSASKLLVERVGAGVEPCASLCPFMLAVHVRNGAPIDHLRYLIKEAHADPHALHEAALGMAINPDIQQGRLTSSSLSSTACASARSQIETARYLLTEVGASLHKLNRAHQFVVAAIKAQDKPLIDLLFQFGAHDIMTKNECAAMYTSYSVPSVVSLHTIACSSSMVTENVHENVICP